MRNAGLQLIAAALVIGGVACAARQAPQAPYVWQLRGAVASIQNTALEVRHKTGGLVLLTLDEQTLYIRDGGRVTSQLLSPGRRVTIEVESEAGVNRARRVDIFGGGTR